MRLFGFLSATRIPAQATSRSQPQPQKTLLPALATHTPVPKPFISVRFTIRSRTRTPQSLPFPNSSSTRHILRKLHIAASSSSDMPHVPFVRSSLLPQHTCTKPDSSTRRDSRLQNRSARSPHKSPSFPQLEPSRNFPLSQKHMLQTITHAKTRCRELSTSHDHPETPTTAWPGHVRNRQPDLSDRPQFYNRHAVLKSVSKLFSICLQLLSHEVPPGNFSPKILSAAASSTKSAVRPRPPFVRT